LAEEEALEEDPRAELVRRLVEYKKFKEAAGELAHMALSQKSFFGRLAAERSAKVLSADEFFEANLFDLISAFSKVVREIPKDLFHEVTKDEFTISEKIHDIYHMLVEKPVLYFTDLFKAAKNKMEIITIFLALLELIRLREVVARQATPFAEITILRNEESIKPAK
jgi:segregation and condensation protein A